MDTLDLIGLLVPVTYLVMLAIEARWPARTFPARHGWRWLGAGFLVLIATVGTLVPLLIPADWLIAHRWIDGTHLGVVGGMLLGYLALSGVMYFWHRAMHGIPLLWRLTHQMHHSPQRVDISGSALFHPIDMAAATLIQLFVTVVVLGLDPLAAAWVGYLTALLGMFQHWNVNTPRWLGYIVQRPEAHCEHHRKGVHAGNYGDVAIWDLLFGTFNNPAHFKGECGFEAPADKRLPAMLGFADVNDAVYGFGSRGARPSP